jgi:hypothetical protein
MSSWKRHSAARWTKPAQPSWKKPVMPAKKRSGVAPWKPIAVVLVAILIYAVYSMMQPGALAINSITSIPLQTNQTVLITMYGGDPVAIKLQRASDTGATLLVTRIPVLYGPVSSVSLAPAGGANVSSNGTRMADMNVKLSGSSPDRAEIQITPLPSALAISASSSISVLSPASFSSPTITNVTITTTTVASTSTSTAPTTSVALTGNALLFQQAMTLMNSTNVGVLMKNYKTLYRADIGCNSITYNTTYFANYHTSPPTVLDYANASALSIRDLSINETLLPALNNVRITYSTLSPSSLSTGPALIAVINTTALSYLKSTSYVGAFQGLNYTRLNASYSFQKAIGNNCGAWIPSS